MIKEPTKATLRKYGLSLDDWLMIAQNQDFKCAICGKEPSTGRLCIDHQHVVGWKRMPAEKRKTFVRGLLCWTCNHYIVGRGVTIEKLENAVKYLNQYKLARVAMMFNW